MKPGTKIRPRYNDTGKKSREVQYFGDKWVVYTAVDGSMASEHVVDRVDFSIKFEVVPDFFEEGKTYIRSDGATGCEYEYLFEVESVRQNEGEATERVPHTAFGRQVTIRDGVEVTKMWMTYTNWSWNKGTWSEKQDV